MNLDEILNNSKLKLEQSFTIISLSKLDLNNVTKEELRNSLVNATRLLMIKENMIKELVKDNIRNL